MQISQSAETGSDKRFSWGSDPVNQLDYQLIQ